MLVRILLSNSLKFTERGEVRLRAELAEYGRSVRLTVTDTGIGIPEDQLDRVFEEFHQVRNPLQTRAVGTGLGLSYARRLAEILSGDLTLTSVLGQRTTVALQLPVRDPDSRGLPELGTVFVVDDESFRDRMGTLLLEFTESVRYAADGRAALDAVADHRPGLVCLDLSSAGLGAALLPKSQLSVETIRLAIMEALMVLPRTGLE
jgi:hypothetical protein